MSMVSLLLALLPYTAIALVSLTCGLAAYFYYCKTYIFKYWEKLGVKTPYKNYPFVGSLWGWWKQNLQLQGLEFKKTCGDFYGIYEGSRPVFIVSDLDAVRDVLVKEFETYAERRKVELNMPVMRKFLTLLHGEEWKETRNAMTPAFSSGKLKRMLPLMEACSEDLVNKINKELKDQQSSTINFKETLRKFTIDAIARCVFATRLNDLDNPNDPFMKNATEMSEKTMQNSSSPLFLLFFLIPARLMSVFFRLIPNSTIPQMDFFAKAVESLLKKYQSSKDDQLQDISNNFIAFLREAQLEEEETKKGSERQCYLIDESIIAQSVIFFVAGFENISGTLGTACFLLAKYPHIQEKLFQEIRRVEEKAAKEGRYKDGHWTHDMIQEVTYADQVLNETLRLYPLAPWLERVTTKEATLCGISLEKDTLVRIPVFTIHHDEELYPSPEVFDPERFSGVNKKDRSPYAFLPFGHGPKNCIGLRFAMEEMKVALIYIVKNFSLRLTWENDALRFPTGFGSMVPDCVKLHVRGR